MAYDKLNEKGLHVLYLQGLVVVIVNCLRISSQIAVIIKAYEPH